MGKTIMPIPKNYKPLYSKKVSNNAQNKIDKIVEKEGVSKWVVIDAIISTSLGVKPLSSLDVKKYLKKF